MKIIFSRRTFYQLIELCVLIFITFTLVFILTHVIPGATAKLANSALPLDQQNALLAQYGLNKPLITQFFIYLNGIFTRLDFGISLSVRINDLVTNVLGPKISLSLTIGGIALLFSFFLGYLIGAIIGMNGRNLFGSLGNLTISFLTAIPAYIIAVVIVAIASISGRGDLVLFSYQKIETWILPVLVLTIPNTAVNANFVSSSIMNESRQQYIKFARAKGLNLFDILVKHLFKPGIFSIITYLPLSLLGIVVGGLFTDSIFSVPGIGGILNQAILSKDYDIIQTLILLFAFITSVVFYLRDLLYVYSDPRIIASLR